MMSEQEQAPYFEQAHRERRAHEAKYPGWSPKDNFGKKAKRKKADNIPVPQNHHHFAFPEAPANQQPVMTWPYATAPKSFPKQALNNQKPFQELPVKTIMINGIPVQATPLEAYLNQARENQAHIEVLPLESFNTPGSAFKDLSNQASNNQITNDLALNNQAPPFNLYEVFLNMAPEDQASIIRLLDQPAT